MAMIATSCQQEVDLGVNAGETATVSINVGTLTRAYSDGLTATVLQYAVYDANGVILSAFTTNDAEINKTATVNLQLVTGNSYTVLFWAAAPNAPYTVNFTDTLAEANITVDYTSAHSNDENRDAFFGKSEFEVKGAQTEAVELKRPFAQLNIGTNDYAAATSAGYTPTQSAVKVSSVYRTLKLASGDVDNAVENVTFAAADIKRDETFPVTGGNYEYLAMNYLLVSTEKENIDVEFTYTNGSNAKSRTVGSVPVQRNHRTNLYGSLLTSDVTVNVEIVPEYEGDFGSEQDFSVVTTVEDLQTAINAATAANDLNVIVLAADIVGDVTVAQKPGVKIQINGANHKYEGSIKVHSNSNYYADAALTVRNLNFETSTAEVNFIEALENGSARYSQNITVENCTFTATGAAVNTVVALQVKASRNVTALNCAATDLHSLIQAQSCDTGDVVVNGCEINGKNGVAFKAVKSALVEGTNIVATGYGIRFDGNIDNYGIVVKNNNVTAVQPLIVRKMTGKNNTIALEGTNTLTTQAEYQVVVTNGSDDAEYVKPTGTYTLTGADNFLVYPRDLGHEVDENGNYHISNVKGWLWMADQDDTFFRNKTVYLDNDIDFANAEVPVTKMQTPEYKATFDGQGHTVYNVKIIANYTQDNQALFDGHMHIKNLNVNGANVCGYNKVGVIGANIHGNIENCHVKNARAYAYVWQVGCIVGLHSWYSIKNCSVEDSDILCFYGGAVGAIAGCINEESTGEISNCVVKNCNLTKEGIGYNPSFDSMFGAMVGAVYIGRSCNISGTIEGLTINGENSTKVYGGDSLPAGSTVTINGVQQ